MKKADAAVENLSMSNIPCKISKVALTACPACGLNSSDTFFCAHCDRVQPLMENPNVFYYLGFEETYSIDLQVLEKNYFDRQMRIHPDKFIGRSDEERAIAASHSAFVNQSYKILKDSYLRAELLCAQKGEALNLASEFDAILLEEAMEKQETLESIDTLEALQEFMSHEQSKINDLENELSLHFASDDFDAVRRVLKFLKYANKLLDDARIQEKKIASVY